MSDFNEERAREITIKALDQTAALISVNRDACVKVLCERLGAPDEAHAEAFLKTTMRLLRIVADSVHAGVDVSDGSEILAKQQGAVH
jgi:hypothetical protein